MKNKKKIIISASNGPIAYELILELKKNFYVIGIDSSNHGVAKKICDEFFISPIGTSKDFIIFINKIYLKTDLIFLFVDEEIKNISNSKFLYKAAKKKIILSSKTSINICLDKYKFAIYCQKNNINVPENKSPYKYLIKPRIGRGSRGIKIVTDKKEISFYQRNKKFISQRYIDGQEYSIDCYFDSKNKYYFGLVRKRVITNGVSLIGDVVNKPDIIDFCIQTSNFFKFYGPINFQLIVEDKTNRIYLIEINPRLSGSIFFSMLSGFNPIKYAFNEIENKLIYEKKPKIKFKKYIRVYNTFLA